MSLNTPGHDPEIQTMDDIEKKMYPELKEKTSYTQPYLVKRFNKIYNLCFSVNGSLFVQS